MTQKFLADVNFWLAFAVPVHTSHTSALYWFSNQANDSVCFCRMAQQGFLRLLTDVRVFKDEAITVVNSKDTLSIKPTSYPPKADEAITVVNSKDTAR